MSMIAVQQVIYFLTKKGSRYVMGEYSTHVLTKLGLLENTNLSGRVCVLLTFVANGAQSNRTKTSSSTGLGHKYYLIV